MKILFVCKHNRFRSKVAEAIFNKLNKNKEIKAESAGILTDDLRPYVAEIVIEVMRQKSYRIYGKPRQLTKNMVNDFDMVVIVADNVNKEFFNDFFEDIVQWQISDCNAGEIDKIKQTIEKIEENVKDLLKNLND